MTPDQLSAINAVSTILERIGTWPIGSIIAVCVLGPWVMMFLIARDQNKRQQLDQAKFSEVIAQQEKRFEVVVAMYESNVSLVKSYNDIANNFQDLVMYNTQSMTEVKEICRSNLFCPVVRRSTKPSEVIG